MFSSRRAGVTKIPLYAIIIVEIKPRRRGGKQEEQNG